MQTNYARSREAYYHENFSALPCQNQYLYTSACRIAITGIGPCPVIQQTSTSERLKNRKILMAACMKRNRPLQKSHGSFRIIGGLYRSRKLGFIEVEGLRPTTDRVRETVFNWLAHQIEGAKVLDLFAGSGALGFEALSRGAETVTMIELDRTAAKMLADNAALLNCQVTIEQANALDWLDRPVAESFDLVFVDPPFRKGLATQVLGKLSRESRLKPGGRVYLETEQEWQGEGALTGWHLIKEKVAGQVCYRLLERV